jgi:hypothetical protein
MAVAGVLQHKYQWAPRPSQAFSINRSKIWLISLALFFGILFWSFS